MSSFNPGGTEGQMIELLRRLDPGRWRVLVACMRAEGAWLGRVAEAADSIEEFPVRSFRRVETVRHMRAFGRWCLTHGVTLVHTTDLPSNSFGLPAAALAGIPVRIANRRELNPGRMASELAMQRAAYACAHRVVANCRAAAERLAFERVPTRKIAIIPNGIRTGGPDASVRDNALRRRVLVVANLRPEKGHDVLLDAAAVVLRQFPDAEFHLVGGGPDLQILRGRTESLGIEESVVFHGHCEDVPARLAAADLFVLPSRSEAFPNAVLEAMAAGLPIVASAVGGIRELLEDGGTGLLVPPGHPGALAEAIGRLMTDRALAASLAAGAQAAARGRYSFDRMVASFDALYRSELIRRGVTSRVPQLAAS